MILTLYMSVEPLAEFVLYQAADIPGLFWHSEPQDLLFWNTIYHMVYMVGEAVAMEISISRKIMFLILYNAWIFEKCAEI